MSEKELNDILKELRGEGESEHKTVLDSTDILDTFNSRREDMPRRTSPQKMKKKKNPFPVIAIIIILIIALVVGGIFVVKNLGKKDNESKSNISSELFNPETKTPKNPLTGESGYNQQAIGKRPVAVVVENEYSTESVRPQWGINNADIIMEGESEFSTRMIMIWADYTNMPSQIGPTRSARPPFIRFSQLFDAIFIHAGLSHTKDDYIGANTVFEEENIDHVNLLSLSDDNEYFSRDKSRTNTVEHTGYLNGSTTPALINNNGFRTELNQDKFSIFSFNEEATPLSDQKAENVSFRWSTTSCPKVGHYTYNQESHKYSTEDFDSEYGTANVAWENLIFLLDETEYFTTVFKSGNRAGQSETYCEYNFTGGNAMVCSEGTYVNATWGVENGKLWIKDTNGNPVKLNIGKTYIGFGSSNHGGEFTIE